VCLLVSLNSLIGYMDTGTTRTTFVIQQLSSIYVYAVGSLLGLFHVRLIPNIFEHAVEGKKEAHDKISYSIGHMSTSNCKMSCVWRLEKCPNATVVTGS
jgi:hypothetical protein